MKVRRFLKRPAALPLALFSLCALLTILLVGFWYSQGVWLSPDQTQADDVLTANLYDVTVGQSFVARQAGLEAIELKVDWPSSQGGDLTLHLREGPEAVRDLRQIKVTAASAMRPDGWLRFPFEPLPDSHSRYYYFFIESSADLADDEASVYYDSPDSYPDGAMYLDGRPQERQLAFRLEYYRPAMLYELARSVATAAPRGIFAVLVFVLPGWALLVLLERTSGSPVQHWLEGASVAVGLSLAIYPILFLWSDLVNWRPGERLVWLTVGVSAVLLIWYYRPWRVRRQSVSSRIQAWVASDSMWADSAALLILLAATAGRLLMVRGLEMPLWQDSVQHSVITQRIMEAGGLFQSWQPYSPHTTFSFHFGFHLNSAVFGWATGMSAPQALIWGGQIFNVFAVFTLYALAYRLKGAWAGVIAILVTGLISQFPLYYTNWGRYPQMLGQAILPAAAWWTWVTLQGSGMRQRSGNIVWPLIGATLIVGSMLGYYRMVLNYLTFVAAGLIVYVRSLSALLDWRKWLALVGAAGIALILILPQLSKLMTSLTGNGGAAAAQPAPTSVLSKMLSVSIVLPAPQALVLLLGTLLILWLGYKAALPAIWFWMLIILPIIAVMPLPGAFLISGFAISTSLYMAIALVLAVAGGHLFTRFPFRWLQALSLLFIFGLAVVQLTRMPERIVRQYDLSSRPDVQAAAWIRDNLPEDAFFLINGFEYKQTAAASDAGWWLPLLTKRQTTIPPQYASFVEQSSIDGLRQITTRLVEQLYEQPPGSDEGKALICDFPYPINHVYIGQNRGIIDGPADDVRTDRPMLPVQQLVEDPAFELLYQRDRVAIFAFDRTVCASG
jgi:hypothetical protein